MTEQKLDQNKAEAFGEKMIEVLNHGATALMVSIGHRTGLFDTMSDVSHGTSEQIAKASF